MSKKSRKRNKKILAALALAGGAAMLAKGRGKGAVTGVVNPNAPKTEYITKKAPVDTAPIITPPGSGGGGIHQGKPPKINPWRGVAPAPPGILNPYRHGAISGRAQRKGGGIAKRGTGAAYKSGGSVKSRGVAKRGGGAEIK